jgi:hypothetical protein
MEGTCLRGGLPAARKATRDAENKEVHQKNNNL